MLTASSVSNTLIGEMRDDVNMFFLQESGVMHAEYIFMRHTHAVILQYVFVVILRDLS